MNTTAFLSTASSDDANAGNSTVTASKHVVQSNFSHVSNGNYEDTRKALEAYLKSLGVPPHTHTAELIMVMERSFKGKYMKGERSHYQQIMPSASWCKDDTLSEKLTRCKDKETFKRRFDSIGTTAILRREHFTNHEIINLDFKENLYLRLIDTNHKNLLRFYRNDAVVDEFIASAIDFYREEMKKGKRKTRTAIAGKPEVLGAGKPEVTYLENPKPLLIKRIKKEAKKNKGTSLTLVPTSPTGKNKKPTPEGIEERKTSEFGIDDYRIAEECGLLAPNIAQASSRAQHRTSTNNASGVEIHRLWRNSVLARNPDIFITASPSKPLIVQAQDFCKKFVEFFEAAELSEFFDNVSANWRDACNYLKEEGVWQKLGNYPEIPALLPHSDKILSWYKLNKASRTRQNKPVPQPIAKIENVTCPSAPYRGCKRITALGRTFNGKDEESLEYHIAYSLLSKWSVKLIDFYRTQLKKYSIDLTASETRINVLCELLEEEFDEYCC
jgi:hypothetical protein